MKTKLICKLLTEPIYKADIYPTCAANLLFKTSARCLSNSNGFIQRFLGCNDIQSKQYQNHYSRWAPNIVKSPKMDYPIPEGTLVENVWSRLDQWPDKVAIVCGVTGRETKYHELREYSKRVAASYLTDLGLSPGQVVAFILPNIPEYPPLLLGAFEAGIIITPMNPIYSVDELSAQLEDSGAVAAVTFPDKLPALTEALSKLGKLDFKIIVTPNIDGSVTQQLPGNCVHYSNLIEKSVDDKVFNSLKPKSVSPEDTVLIPYSSGTTGKPKGVCLTNRNLTANNATIRYFRFVWDATSSHQDVVPVLLPIFHVYGLTVILITSLGSGAKLVTLPKFEEATFLKSLKDYKATVLYLAPPLVLYLANSPAVTKDHLISLRLIVSGAAPLGEEDINKCMKKSSGNLTFTQGYGLSETSPCVTSIPEGVNPSKRNTVGVPAPNTQIKVADLQTGQALGPNEEGEIWVKGPQVMKGYLNNAEATKACLDEEGWFRTGDVGYYDDKGYFYITDRVKELIKVSGFQVAPSELEEVLRSHSDVQDAGVIGVPHSKYGETPIAFVKSEIKDEKLMEQQLKTYLKEKLAKYKQPSMFIFIDNIPKSGAGKILRKDLKVMYKNLMEK